MREKLTTILLGLLLIPLILGWLTYLFFRLGPKRFKKMLRDQEMLT